MSAQVTRERTAVGWFFAGLVGLTAAYFVLAKFGLQLASVNPSASPIWPPTGLALAAVLLWGPGVWPAIFAGAFLANFTHAGTLETSAAIACGNTLEAVVGGWLVRRWSGGADTFETPGRIARFAAIVFVPASAISATVGVTTLAIAGLAAWADFGQVWATWWLGDAAGALVVTPVLVLWAKTDLRAFYERELRDTAIALGLAFAVGLIAFSPLLPRSEYTSPLGFLAILPLLWAALRRGPRDTATVAIILTGFTVWVTLEGSGPFAHTGQNETFLLLLTFMISMAVPSLALSADVRARHSTESSLRTIQDELDRRVRERTAELADANIHLLEAQRLANLGSWAWEIADNRVAWSRQLCDIYGVPPDKAPTQVEQFVAFLHPDDRAKVTASISAALEGGREFSHEERIRRPDGGVRHLQSIGEVIRDDIGRPLRMLGVCLDVTERKHAESALQSSEQSNRLLLKSVRDYAIYMLDLDGNVRSWNSGAAYIKGYSAEEIIGQNFRRFYTEEDRAAKVPERAIATALREGRYEAQGWRVRKDGTRFYANVVVDSIRDDDGVIVGFAKITRDITDQYEAQRTLERTREQLAQAQKMEALGQLTGGVAHDFNNLLMIVSGYAQILRRKLSDPKEVQAVEAIRAAAGRGEKLTRQLLTFSRRQHLKPEVLDLRKRIDALRDMLAPSLQGNIELVVDVDESIWPVEVDLDEFDLALVNVAVNARDAMPEGGSLTLRARNVVLRRGDTPEALEGDFVALSIIDTGTGIPPDVLARVFEPFFTTKPVGKGTGLGLSQVHGFAVQSGGSVAVKTEAGKGTSVTLYLPRVKAGAAIATEAAKTLAAERSQGTVLLVEDTAAVAEVTEAMLDQLGYRVVRMDNAVDALRRLEGAAADIDFVLSDIVMPGAFDGLGLATRCRERFPRVPVLLTSGFSDAAQSAAGRFSILRKPYDLQDLQVAMEDARATTRGGKTAAR